MITDLKDLLNTIGYSQLRDDGTYWRTNAIYRDGDNKTSLRINKRTGDFKDFVEKKYGNVNELIKLTLRIGETELKKFYEGNLVDLSQIVSRDDKPKLTMEKTWNESELNNLLPHFKFYEDRGISKDTLKFLRSGFAHSGSMNERYVFPIYSLEGPIHGWSGRDMTGKKDAKWKHIGRKASWVYPAFVPLKTKNTTGGWETTYPVLDEIRRTREVILVESIGDMISLREKGQRNVLVTFGLVLSSKLGSFLLSLDLDCVVVALNNDENNDVNRGKHAALDMFLDLMHYVDAAKLKIVLPIGCNDFGEMNEELFERWKTKKNLACNSNIYKAALDKLTALYRANKISKTEIQFGKLIKNLYDQSNPEGN